MRFDRALLAVFGTAALPAAVAACASSGRISSDSSGGPSIVFPAHFAEGENRGASKPDAAPAAAPDAGVAPGRVAASPPDPPPLVTRSQWLYRFRYERGKVVVAGVVRRELERPTPTERHVGRFAVELWVGAELIDRVRFDFPLLAADPAPRGLKRPLHEEPSFGPGAETSRDVLVPASDRATRAVLVDRLDGHSVPLPWPPVVGPADSGTSFH